MATDHAGGHVESVFNRLFVHLRYAAQFLGVIVCCFCFPFFLLILLLASPKSICLAMFLNKFVLIVVFLCQTPSKARLQIMPAHMSQVYSIDWSYTCGTELISCGQDKTVKVSWLSWFLLPGLVC